MTEEWKSIAEYNGLYEVSNIGNVRRIYYPTKKHKEKRYKIVTPYKTKEGYYRLSLSKNGIVTKHFVHRLVAIAFIENANNVPVVNHIDGNKTNNSVENLEWCTQAENNRHAYNTGLNKYHPEHLPHKSGENSPSHILTQKDVIEIRSLLKEGKLNQHEIGRMYGVSNFTICDIKRGRSWKEVV